MTTTVTVRTSGRAAIVAHHSESQAQNGNVEQRTVTDTGVFIPAGDQHDFILTENGHLSVQELAEGVDTIEDFRKTQVLGGWEEAFQEAVAGEDAELADYADVGSDETADTDIVEQEPVH